MQCNGFGVCCGINDPPLILNHTVGVKCNGVDDPNCLCGGTETPEPCPGGYYCPTPDVKMPCDSGDYCRPGSTGPDPCPVGTDIPFAKPENSGFYRTFTFEKPIGFFVLL